MKRVFVAIDIPEESKGGIGDVQKEISEISSDFRLTRSENLHLTLKFLGEIDETKLEKVKKELSTIRMKKFEATLGEIGVFDNSKSRKYEKQIVVWIKVDNCDELQKSVDNVLSGVFTKEKRFMSHLTIARSRKENAQKAVDEIKNIKTSKMKFEVNVFKIKESILTNKGPSYKDIQKYPLN